MLELSSLFTHLLASLHLYGEWLFFGEQSATTSDERGSSKILAFDDFAWAYAVRKQSVPL
jgi:hypothetical protein